jgi:alkylhydroperoxidase family enzyme
MATPPPEPRIRPLGTDELDEEARSLLAKVGPHGADVHLFATVVRHPRLFRRWLPLVGGLLSGELHARDRELLILRTAVRCCNAYEWAHHQAFAARAGLTAAEIEQTRLGADAPDWSPHEQALLRAADELHDTSHVSDGTWAVLRARYTDTQLIEIPMVVGHYHLVAYVLHTLQIQLEEEQPT